MSSNYYNDDKPQFNMAILFLERINKRLDEINVAAATGDLYSWYRLLKVIYRSIHFKIEENKEKDFEINNKLLTLFVKIENALKNIKNVQGLGITLAEQHLNDCDQLLNDLLYKYDLIFPKKMFSSFIEEIEADY